MMKMGLHGRSFIPLLLGFGCSVASVMAARTVDGESNRLTTILVSPLMSCAGRLPIYILIAGVFFPAYAGTIVFLMYMLGIVMAIVVSLIFKKVLFREESSSLLMELSQYQIPTAHGSFRHMWDRGLLFLKTAGTYLMIGSIIMWVLSSFGFAGYGVPVEASFASMLGRIFEPLFLPLGFSWQIGTHLWSHCERGCCSDPLNHLCSRRVDSHDCTNCKYLTTFSSCSDGFRTTLYSLPCYNRCNTKRNRIMEVDRIFSNLPVHPRISRCVDCDHHWRFLHCLEVSWMNCMCQTTVNGHQY